MAGVALAYALLPAPAYAVCRENCSTFDMAIVSVIELLIAAAVAFATLRLVRRWYMRVLTLLLAVLIAGPLQHTLAVYL
jgi:hypothetical protein